MLSRSFSASVTVDKCAESGDRWRPIERVSDREIYFSAITIGEITKGIALLDPGQQQFRLQGWLHGIEQDYAHQILPVDREIARLWGDLRRIGVGVPVADGLIAATAAYHAMPLMTRNVRPVKSMEIEITDP